MVSKTETSQNMNSENTSNSSSNKKDDETARFVTSFPLFFVRER